MAKTIKMNKYIVMFSLFFIFLIVTCCLGYREGYVDNIITGPGGNKLVINDDDDAVAVITDNDDIYINEDVIDDDYDYDDADINTYYGKYGNSVTVAQGPAGNTAVNADVNNRATNPSDYVLKSQIVPPVCPVCPSLISSADANNSSDDSNGDSNGDSSNDDTNGDSNSNSNSDSNGDDSNGNDGTCTSESCYQGNTYKREVNVKCPPCPPCARCPEPAFDCKKVPTYRESDDRYLPKPILSDFSTFGM